MAIAFIGFFTGFYLVPLYSLLQHRAPKASKGDSVATSNFLNITGAIAASVLFFALTLLAQGTGYSPRLPEVGEAQKGDLGEVEMEHGHPLRVVVDDKEYRADRKGPHYVYLSVSPLAKKGDTVVARRYVNKQEGVSVTKIRFQPAGEAEKPFYDQSKLPALLFLGAGGLTLVILAVLAWILPDLFRRTGIWMSMLAKGVRLETAGLLRLPGHGPVILATRATGEARAHVESAVDRVTNFVDGDLARGEALLKAGWVVAVDPATGLAGELAARVAAPVLPVQHFQEGRNAYVVAGPLLPADRAGQAGAELDRLDEQLRARTATGEPLEMFEEH